MKQVLKARADQLVRAMEAVQFAHQRSVDWLARSPDTPRPSEQAMKDGRTAGRAAWVILLTGWGQRLVGDADVAQSVDHVLSKPPKLSELRQALARYGEPVPERTTA